MKKINTDKVQKAFLAMVKHIGTDQVADMLQIAPDLNKKDCAEWLVENAYNQADEFTEGLTEIEIKKLDKLLMQEAKIIASDAL